VFFAATINVRAQSLIAPSFSMNVTKGPRVVRRSSGKGSPCSPL
jgi:hypothetical protein